VLYDPIAHRLLGHYGSQVHVTSQGWLGITLFCLGFPDQALARSSAAIAEARRLAHQPSLAGNLATGIRLRLLVGDNAALGEWVDQLVTVTAEQGFAHWRAMGAMCRGWVKVKNGNVAEGISLLRSGSGAFRATGAWRPHNVALLAGCGKSRDFGKTVMKRARNGNLGLIKSTGYEGAKGDELGWKHHRPTFSAAC